MSGVLVDTGFFFALFNKRDRNHSTALKLQDLFETQHVILPWPVLYETVNTRLARNSANLERFSDFTQKPNIQLFDDSQYREKALKEVLNQQLPSEQTSLVDAILCCIIEDPNVPITALLTFDQRDFFEICLKYSIDLVSDVN